jgi:hypothetical protein
MRHYLKREGKGGFEHYHAIESGDLQRVMEYFDINDSTKSISEKRKITYYLIKQLLT